MLKSNIPTTATAKLTPAPQPRHGFFARIRIAYYRGLTLFYRTIANVSAKLAGDS